MDDRRARDRRSIDNIDAALVAMLAERFKVTQAVGQLKAGDVPVVYWTAVAWGAAIALAKDEPARQQ